MTWTYTENPVDKELDALRLEIGDTDENYPLLQDEEIQYFETQEPNFFATAARCCEAISAKLAREADRTIGPTQVKLSQQSEAYTKQAKRLRKKAGTYKKPLADISTESLFKKGMMDNNQ